MTTIAADARPCDDFDVDVDGDVDVEVGEARPGLAGPTAGPAWPAAVPAPAEAAAALARALAGDGAPPGAPLAAAVAALTGLERSVLVGEPQPIDTEPVRRAAALRVRVAVALAAAPPEGGEVDAAAVSALLGEVDALLSDLCTLGEDAPADLQASLGAVRDACVQAAVALSAAARRCGDRLHGARSD
jgi:hypothetical protein